MERGEVVDEEGEQREVEGEEEKNCSCFHQHPSGDEE